MGASKKKIINYTLDQLEITSDEIETKVKLENLYFPENENEVEMIQGSDSKDKAIKLISKLKESGII